MKDELEEKIRKQEKELDEMMKNAVIELMHKFVKASYEQFKRENDSFWVDMIMVVLFYIVFFSILYGILNWITSI